VTISKRLKLCAHTDQLKLNIWSSCLFVTPTRFVSNPLMLPKNKMSLTSSIKKALNNIHEKYVLVPADKAANNVIFI